MIKKFGVFVVAVVLMMSPLIPSASAAPNQQRNNNHITQSELALMLVNVLGLYRYLPAPPSVHNAIEILLVNQIAPADGWQPDRVVTRADLARVIVQAIDRSDEIEDPDNPQSWIDYLVGIGIPIDTVGVALESVDPMGEPVAPYLLASSASTDPLKQQTVFGQPDEVAFGTDMTFIASDIFVVTLPEAVDVIIDIPRIPPRRRPVTPD